MSISCHPWPYKKTVTKYKLELLADKKKSFNSLAIVAHSVFHSEQTVLNCTLRVFAYYDKERGNLFIADGYGIEELT